jgi:glycosyltransferase involved in cell wall biosynthesis
MKHLERPVHRFVVPALDGPVTGGTVYNRALLDALRREAFSFDVLDIDGARASLQSGRPGWYWVDTLHLGEMRGLRSANASSQPLGLLTHYLPSLVVRGETLHASDLTPDERFALKTVRAFVATSPFMGRVLRHLGAGRRPVLVVEPGCELHPLESVPRLSGVRALMVANVVEQKGIAPLLAALRAVLLPRDPFRLTIVGSLERSPSYAASCLRLVSDSSLLDPRVTFRGEVPPGEVFSHLEACNLFVSSSRMEAYAMAIAEARTAGLPVVACDGGNVRSLVEPASGGEIVADAADLARACIRLCRRPEEHEQRLVRAREKALAPRPWSVAANELAAGLVRLDERTRRRTSGRTRA